MHNQKVLRTLLLPYENALTTNTTNKLFIRDNHCNYRLPTPYHKYKNLNNTGFLKNTSIHAGFVTFVKITFIIHSDNISATHKNNNNINKNQNIINSSDHCYLNYSQIPHFKVLQMETH